MTTVKGNSAKHTLSHHSTDEIEELLLQELETLFDKPCLIPIQKEDSGSRPQSAASSAKQLENASTFKIGFEKDYTNTFLITNPAAIFKVFDHDQFLALPEQSQCLLLERLEDIMQKCTHNAHILTDHIVQTNVNRLNSQTIRDLARDKNTSLKEPEDTSRTTLTKSLVPENDILILMIQLCLKLAPKNPNSSKKLIELIKRLSLGRRFQKTHLEYIYQYLKVNCESLCMKARCSQALTRLETSIKVILGLFESRFEIGPQNYFYFSGFLSGIQVNTKAIPNSEFTKGFAAAMWFQVQDQVLQDDKNLPVLFNCFIQGNGGFECYFNQRKLFYRILSKQYVPPNVDSNGIQIGEFQPKKWYFLAIEHEKPFMTRAQVTAIINDKQVVNQPMDYPKIEKSSKITMIAICKNFVGQLSSFMLFKEQVNNAKKMIQMYIQYEFGLHSSSQLNRVNQEIFDAKLTDKLFIFYTPERTFNKTVYDCIEIRDAELMVNSGVSHQGPKQKLFFCGGLNSLLPLLDLLRGILQHSRKEERNISHNMTVIVNDFLRLVNSVISTKSFTNFEAENSNFFKILFHLLTQLPPKQAVNSETIQLLAEIRFQIGDSSLQEQFFQNLMYSSDFWINSDNVEVINEYWLFVKAIYSQNAVQYNKLFSIQNLIDLMVKISEIKDGGYCCEYHMNTYMMFYQGQLQGQTLTGTQLLQIKMDESRGDDLRQMLGAGEKQLAADFKNSHKTHQINKYLSPIAGVLEGVLTSGGNEILDQIQYIAKALTVKSSPCFHLQMLKLLKVLLLDSKEDRHCASPGDFAENLLKAKGLQILLYLCSNSSFDVKSMCVKLIDVLSSHTSLIKMAIDPDVITYLCNIILPRSMMDQANLSQKNQMFKTNQPEGRAEGQPSISVGQYQMVDEEEFSQSPGEVDANAEDDDDFDEAQFQEMVRKKNTGKDGQPLKKQFKGLFLEDDQEQEDKDSFELIQFKEVPKQQQMHSVVKDTDEDMESEEIVTTLLSKKKASISGDSKKRVSMRAFNEEIDSQEDDYDPLFSQPPKQRQSAKTQFHNEGDEELEMMGGRPPPPAPKNRSKTMKFDFDSDPKDAKSKFNQTSKVGFFGKNSKQTLLKEVAESQEKSDNSNGEGGDDFLSGLEFGIVGFQGGNSTNDKKKMMMNTQKLPSLKGKSTTGGFAKSRGLELAIDEHEVREPRQREKLSFPSLDNDDAAIENQDFTLDSKQKGAQLKNKSPTSFANENVMSKSNLRQPKSFNFGFPDDSDSEEEKKSEVSFNETAKTSQIDQEDEDIALVLKPKPQSFSKPPPIGKRGNLMSKNLTLGSRGKPSLTIEDSNEDKAQDDSSNTQSEDASVEKAPQGKKKELMGGTTGATSETHYEPRSQSREKNQQTQPLPTKVKAVISFKEKARLFTNTNAKLNIDTDAINEEFNYGGEKGQKQMTEDEELETLEQEIEELASLCVAAMKRKSPDDPIELDVNDKKVKKQTFENKFLKKDGTKNSRAQFMVPQSVKGIKKIDMSSTQEEKLALLESSGGKDKFSLGGTFGAGNKNFSGLKSIVEEVSPQETNKSESSRQEFNFGLQTADSGLLEELKHNSNKKPLHHNSTTTAHSMTFAGSNLLNAEKQRKGSTDNALAIFSQNELTLQNANNLDQYTVELENLYTSCLEWIISRAPSSLYENIVIDDCDKIGYQPAIQLLMTLVTYSNNLVRQKALQDLLMLAQWDSNNGTQIMVHPQFHSWLLEILLPYQDITNKYSQNYYGNSLAVYDIGCKLHTLLLKNACISSEEEAYKKLNFLARWPSILQLQADQGIKGRTEKDVEVANKLIRILFNQLVLSLKDEAKQKREISRVHVTWHNLIYAIHLIEEIVVSSNRKAIDESDHPGSQNRDVNVSLLKWVQKDYLLYNYGSNEKSLWAEWDLIESIFQVVDTIYPDWLTKRTSQKISLEEQIFNTLQKCSPDEFSSIVEIFVHDCSPYKTQGLVQGQVSGFTILKQPKQQKVKNVIANVISGVSPLGGGKQAQPEQQQQTSSNGENTFMRNIINLLCIAITQSDTKQLVQLWLDRLERFIKYIMVVSETWKSRLVSTVYASHQKKFSDIITYAFAFLFHEIHATNRSPTPSSSSTHQNSFPMPTFWSTNQSQQSQSPKDQQFNKMFAQSLKNLMIYFINIIEYAKMKNTPLQLESHVTACRNIFNNVLIIRESQGQVENLIQARDISRIKSSDYDDFPECFYMDDWKVTFFNSDVINKVIKSQLNLRILNAYVQKRIQQAQHYLDMQISNDRTKDDILKRMQCDTVEVIGTLSEIEFERKNKVALMNDNFSREQSHCWKQAKKKLFSSRGAWENLGEQYLKANLYRIGDGVKAIMTSRPSNNFELLEGSGSELTQKIFKEVNTSECSLFNSQTLPSDIGVSPSKPVIAQPDKKKRMTLKSVNSDDEEDDEEEEEELQIVVNETQKEEPVIVFFSKPLTQREKISMKKQYIQHLKEHIYTFRPKIKELLELKCAILKPFYQRPGTIQLTANDIIFFDDLFNPLQVEKDNIFFLQYQKKQNDLLYKIIPLSDLKEIQKRRFLGRNAALELFMVDSSSIMLNFNSTDDREQFAKKIVRQRKKKCSNLKYYDTLDAKKMLKKRELTESWMQWKISNFEYIMQLNQLSGRSYNDLSQYPVFPWIIVDYTSKSPPDLNAFNSVAGGAAPGGFRDLNKNMQLIGSAERQAEFKKKYDDSDSFYGSDDRYHCGSHYSNPGIVLHYLSRLSPYIDALVDLHGKNMDKPDRAFHSIQDSLTSALNDYSDVRELIPEFFFCPEMFQNLNRINFGIKQDNLTEVNDIVLPEWCQQDPYLFCIFQREAFETNYVSQNISGWIDYIFGFKQKSSEAEKTLNLFPSMTYEDSVDIDSIQDELTKKSTQQQIYNYGQTPSQLFQKSKHLARLPKSQAIKWNSIVDTNSKIKVYKPVVQLSAATQKQMASSTTQLLLTQEAILKAKFADDQTIVGLSKDGTVTYFFWLSKAHELNPQTPFTCCEDKKRKYDTKTKIGGLDQYDRSIKKFDFPILILNNFKCVMRGGFWGGRIIISPIEGVSNDAPSALVAHQTTVTSIVCTQNEKVVISGSKSGEVIVWQYVGVGNTNVSNESNWQIRKHLCDHENQIGMIYINEEMTMYATCSFDGTANLYNLGNDKLYRSFKHPKLAPVHSVILSQAPLPALCFFSREDHCWYSFSLNGKLLEKSKDEYSHIIGPQVIKDSHFMDKLVYGTEKGYLIFRQLPLLKQIKKQQVSANYPVLTVITSADRRFLLVGCGDGGLNVVTEPFVQPQMMMSSQSQLSQQTMQKQGSFQSTLQPGTQILQVAMNTNSSVSSSEVNSAYRE